MMIGLLNRRVIASAVMVAALASAVTVVVGNHQARDAAGSAELPNAQAAGDRKRPLVSPLVPELQRSLADVTEDAPRDAAFLAQVERKYRFLIADIDEEHVDELRRRLLQRESEMDADARARADVRIGKLLPAESFAYYQALKNSDHEQHRLAEYAGGIGKIAPLDERQERIVLDAKLRQKQRYAAFLQEATPDGGTLSREERAYVQSKAAAAFKRYMEDFLAEVAPSLGQEQYAQLKNYEATEFVRELSRLQQRIDAK